MTKTQLRSLVRLVIEHKLGIAESRLEKLQNRIDPDKIVIPDQKTWDDTLNGAWNQMLEMAKGIPNK